MAIDWSKFDEQEGRKPIVAKKQTKSGLFDFSQENSEFVRWARESYSDYKRRLAESEARWTIWQQSWFETWLQWIWAAAWFVWDVIWWWISAFTPEPVKNLWKNIIKKSVELSPLTPYLKEPAKEVMGWASKWSKENPRASANVWALFNIATYVPAIWWTAKAWQLATKVWWEVLETWWKQLVKSWVKSQRKKVYDIIRPVLSTDETAKEIAWQRMKKWVLKDYVVKMTPYQEEMADVVEPVLRKTWWVWYSKNQYRNINKLNKEVWKLNASVEWRIAQSSVTRWRNELIDELNKIEPISWLQWDDAKALMASTNRFIEKYLGKDTYSSSDIFNIRKEYDKFIKEELPNAFDWRNTNLKSAVWQIRSKLNDIVANDVWDDFVKQTLRKEHLMMTARDNIAERLAKDVDWWLWRKIYQAIERHPFLATTAALTWKVWWIWWALTITWLLSNPLTWTALAWLWAFKIWKTALTNPQLRKAIWSAIEKLWTYSKKLSWAEKKEIDDIINTAQMELKKAPSFDVKNIKVKWDTWFTPRQNPVWMNKTEWPSKKPLLSYSTIAQQNLKKNIK